MGVFLFVSRRRWWSGVARGRAGGMGLVEVPATLQGVNGHGERGVPFFVVQAVNAGCGVLGESRAFQHRFEESKLVEGGFCRPASEHWLVAVATIA